MLADLPTGLYGVVRAIHLILLHSHDFPPTLVASAIFRMLGARYRLRKPTRAVYADAARKGFVLLPEDAVLMVEGSDGPRRLLKVRWNNLVLLMFSQDLTERGVEVEETAAARVAAASHSDPLL